MFRPRLATQKPAKIKMTPEGKVKILDFGPAKAFQEEPSASDMAQSPTLTEAVTRAGVILGTAAYGVAKSLSIGRAMNAKCVRDFQLTQQRRQFGDQLLGQPGGMVFPGPWTNSGVESCDPGCLYDGQVE